MRYKQIFQNSSSTIAAEKYLKEVNKKYEEELTEPKVLLLGSSDSGKTTLLRQMKILYYGGFQDKEYIEAVINIRRNLKDFVICIFRELSDQAKAKYQTFYSFIETWSEVTTYTVPMVKEFQEFWKDSEVQVLYESSKMVPSNIDYFLGDLERVLADNYFPTNEDMLKMRVVTRSVSATVFEKDGQRIHFFDVSGLSYHRTKWTCYFEAVETILFVTSLSCYNQTLVEDPNINRAQDSIALFEKVCNIDLLKNTAIVILLNKTDLFKKKVKNVSIKDYFPGYEGKIFDYSQGSAFFKQQYLSKTKFREYPVTSHFTCCTDITIMNRFLKTLM